MPNSERASLEYGEGQEHRSPYGFANLAGPEAGSVLSLPTSRGNAAFSENRYLLSPQLVDYALERLELLEPDLASILPRSLQTYACAYSERYYGDVPQLERERDFLLAALSCAWQEEQYGLVVQLVAGLAHLAGRLDYPDEGERLLLWGIEAARRLQDLPHLARFLNRLNGLLCAHGKYEQARQAWRESREAAEALGYPLCIWEPLAHFVHMVDMLGSYDDAQRFAERLLNVARLDNPESLAVALFARAFFARGKEKLDAAYQDLAACLKLLSLQPDGAPSTVYRRVFCLEVQTELARVRGDYERAREYTEATLALAQSSYDPYALAALLFDQALFAYRHEMFSDAYTYLLRLVALGGGVELPFYTHMGRSLLRNLSSISHEYRSSTADHNSSQRAEALWSSSEQWRIPVPARASREVHQVLSEPLSRRELAVLQLVAEGLSNREIAARLVITIGTAKKHIEHIYGKLGVGSRTQAVAKARALQLLP